MAVGRINPVIATSMDNTSDTQKKQSMGPPLCGGIITPRSGGISLSLVLRLVSVSRPSLMDADRASTQPVSTLEVA